MVISRDITEKRRLEQEKLQYNQTLKNQVEELTEKMNHLFLSSLTSLVNTLETKDSYTNGHSLRVTHISKTFVEQVFGQIPLLLDIELAAKLHDIGKIGIRENILNKPEKLTEEEYAQMKQHPVIMETILSPFTHLKEVIHIAKHHHEHFDGKGYPDQLKGESIPFGSRILALADTYDAMTSSRPYRKALDPEMALVEIRKNLGTQFDPDIGIQFTELVESGTL
jgi:HD-GYP domain-containing protein (c-di-GMP phosphodiesterase class II)